MTKATAFLNELSERGWSVMLSNDGPRDIPTLVTQRVGRVTHGWAEFAGCFTECVNADENGWFLSSADYRESDNAAFSWNEWERLSLEAAEGEADIVSKVRRFWTLHLPIYIGLDPYSYYALCTSTTAFGSVVRGEEPEFEKASRVSASFPEFLEWFLTQ